MKKLVLLFSLCPIFLWGQVKTDFENGLSDDWEQSPAGRWGVSSEHPLSGLYSLKHLYDNPESGCDAISYYFNDIVVDSSINYSFLLHYNYKPSASNKWGIFLLSQNDVSGFSDNNHALILGVNQTGTDDSLRLYFQAGKQISVEYTFPVNWEIDVGLNTVIVKLEKDEKNYVEINLFLYSDSIRFIHKSVSPVKVPEFPCYFGISYCYTSSKDRLLSFDDFEMNASFFSDTIPPKIIGIDFIDPKSIAFTFDEDIFYQLKPDLAIESFFPVENYHTEGRRLIAIFSEPFTNEERYFYQLNGIMDRKANSSSLSGEFVFYYPAYKDIIFTEILADPVPAVYLPTEEYLEIYNRSSHDLNLLGWKLTCGTRSHLLPEYILQAKQYLLISSVEGIQYSDKQNNLQVLTSSTELTNSGLLLSLETPLSGVIDALQYNSNWYEDDMKKEGGWSLERIDLDNLCGKGDNWKASEHPDGGTPGEKNSLEGTVIDNEQPYIERLIYLDSLQYSLQVNETVKKITDDGENSPGTLFLSLEFVEPLFDECIINLFPGTELPFVFRVPLFMEDCGENTNTPGDTVLFTVPEKPEFVNLLISEVMFAPEGNAPEFIEIYNYSDKTIGLNNLTVQILGEETDNAVSFHVTEEEILFHPGKYIAVANNKEELLKYYYVPDKSCIIETEEWRSLSNSFGRIRLTDRSGILIDEMKYSGEMHYPMFSAQLGVSLERIQFNPVPGILAEWHSASSISDFSTPGYLNSQSIHSTVSNSSFACQTEKFTPDNDGDTDIAVFSYTMEREGYVGSFWVFDASGRLVRKLYNNTLLGVSGTLSWDGRNDRGALCPTGIYLGLLDVFHLSGSRKVLKESVVLIRTGY